jgi:agmatinase
MAETKCFGGIPEEFGGFERASILLQPVPYDGTSTWGKGADKGLEAFLEAAENMELYDIETDSEVYTKGIHILDAIREDRSPEEMYQAVRNRTTQLLQTGKFLTFFGGEHSISIGVMEAFHEKYPEMSVLQLDAHADLRPSYLGSEFNHACAMHRASRNLNLVQVGIRSMDLSEKEYLDPQKCFYAHQIAESAHWMDRSIDLLSDQVYVTIDLDVLDPSVMPSTGTPEPGGMEWNVLIRYLKKVFQAKEVVGFDLVELAPLEHLKAPNFLVSKLYYKLLSYKFFLNQ